MLCHGQVRVAAPLADHEALLALLGSEFLGWQRLSFLGPGVPLPITLGYRPADDVVITLNTLQSPLIFRQQHLPNIHIVILRLFCDLLGVERCEAKGGRTDHFRHRIMRLSVSRLLDLRNFCILLILLQVLHLLLLTCLVCADLLSNNGHPI